MEVAIGTAVKEPAGGCRVVSTEGMEAAVETAAEECVGGCKMV